MKDLDLDRLSDGLLGGLDLDRLLDRTGGANPPRFRGRDVRDCPCEDAPAIVGDPLVARWDAGPRGGLADRERDRERYRERDRDREREREKDLNERPCVGGGERLYEREWCQRCRRSLRSRASFSRIRRWNAASGSSITPWLLECIGILPPEPYPGGGPRYGRGPRPRIPL